jgi:hypothetical protein
LSKKNSYVIIKNAMPDTPNPNFIPPSIEPAAVHKPTVVPSLLDNYLALITNSKDSKLFRQWYCLVDGQKTEVMDDGSFSCAFYVTSLLKLLDLAHEIQITVHRAISEMERSGWQTIAEPRRGAVVVWDAIPAEDQRWGRKVKHIGFCLGDGHAISASAKQRQIVVHPLDYRPILFYLWHAELDKTIKP